MEINYHILWEVILDRYPNTKHISELDIKIQNDIIAFTGFEEYPNGSKIRYRQVKYSYYKNKLRDYLLDSILK